MSRKVADRFGGSPVVNVFEFEERKTSDLYVKEFNEPDREWAEFVMANRSRSQAYPADEFDLIIGPVANDDIATLFRTYAFRTERAVSLLQKRESI